MKVIPYGRQDIDESDVREVVNVLKSDYITQGAVISRFEEALAKYCGAKYSVAVSSGTAALHLACLAAGLRKGDEAITTPITFLATPNSILYTNAKPVFADIENDSVNIDPEQIRKKITKKTKAILPVHFAGLPCNMREIAAIAKKNRLTVIEDACHALGAEYKNRGRWVKVGGCVHSDMSVFSFHPVKSITTGEGGAITTNNRNLYRKLLALRSHGIYKNRSMRRNHGLWYYEMRDMGFNYRITDIQCALGLSQLKKLDSFISIRQKIANFYDKKFYKLKYLVKLPQIWHKDKKHAWHLYILRLNSSSLKLKKIHIFNDLRKRNINLQLHYIPVVSQPFYRSLGYNIKSYPIASRYYEEAMSIPMFTGLRNNDLNYVADNLAEVFYKYHKD